jgi:apolipoprotein N-acyltransferase
VLRNGLYLVAPEPGQAAGELSPMQVYHKSILFPFAEYIPLLDEETAKRWFPRASHFSNGEGVVTMEVQADGESVRLGPSICYEDLFSNHAATLARAGADVIVNVSNDSWFGDYGAARLHLATARLRSIETRLPQVRATNSGYSALILPNGEIRGQTEFGVQEATTFEVPILRLEPTLRVELGDWFGPFSLVLGLLLALPLARRNSGRR